MLVELFEVEARVLHLAAGALLGLVFGAAAQISRFCLRRAVAGDASERTSAGAVWVTGFAVAALAMAIASSLGLVDVSDHRFLSANLPFAAILLGGAMFGVGMVLTRGCVSRLTVLSATGNLRALTVLAVFAITAHATIKGVLAPVRTSLGSLSIELGAASLSALPFGLFALAAGAGFLAIWLYSQSRTSLWTIGLGGLVGLVAAAGWVATSTLLFDEFDPLPVQSAAFTLPWSDTLFWVIASTAIPAGFGVGFIGGVLSGSFVSAGLRGELQLRSFTSGAETLRYLAGGTLMGVGGVLAGGCTIGAGIAGSSTGSFAALLALAAVIVGGFATSHLQTRTGAGVPSAA